MKIKLSHLGPIHDEVQFELKPLTIFIGPNNAGKTWLAYTLAALFGKFGFEEFTDNKRTASILETYPPVANAINKLLKTGLASMDIYQFAEDYGEKYHEEIVSSVRKNLPQFMGTRLISFEALQISTELDDIQLPFLKRIQDTALDVDTTLGKIKNTNGQGKQKSRLKIAKQEKQNNISMGLTFEGQIEAEISQETIQEIKKHIIEDVFRTLRRALFSDVAILPTERTTFLTQPFSIGEQDTRVPSIPVSDYISCVISVNAIGVERTAARKQEAKHNSQVQKYIDLSHLLEEQILNGKVDFSTPEPDSKREITFQPKDNESAFEISLASSMVKELAPLVLHLRYFAQPNELLIIDEPEMNLHPKAQAQVLELLVMLVNAGVNVLITTHSPYMIDHLGNLTQAYQHSDKESIRAEFFLKHCEAFIDENRVSTYLIDKGTMIDFLHNEELDGDTFGEISDRLSQIYFSSYENKEHPLDNL